MSPTTEVLLRALNQYLSELSTNQGYLERHTKSGREHLEYAERELGRAQSTFDTAKASYEDRLAEINACLDKYNAGLLDISMTLADLGVDIKEITAIWPGFDAHIYTAAKRKRTKRNANL